MNILRKIGDWIKENPWLAGGLAVGAVILIWLMRRNSAANQAATASQGVASPGVAGTGLSESGYLTLQEANLQASQNIQAAQLQAGVQTSAQQSQLQGLQAQYATQLAIAQLQSQDQLQQIQSTASSADLATQAALTSSLASISAHVSETQIGADEAVQIAQDQTSVQLAQIAATNTANSVIAQLAGILAGVPGNPPPPSSTTTPTTTVVPTVPPTQTTSGGTTPPVTSQPGAVNPAVSSQWVYTSSPTLAQLDEAQALISGMSYAQVVANIPQDPNTGILKSLSYGFQPAQYQGGPIGGGGYLQVNPATGQVAYTPPSVWGAPPKAPIIGTPGAL